MSTIKDGLKLPSNRFGKIEIPNTKRRELPDFFVEMGYKKRGGSRYLQGRFYKTLRQ